MSEWLAFLWHFLLLGSVAVGGVSTVMPDMYRYVVDENAMMTGREFSELYALAQASPGPNALWVTLLGLRAAGWSGMLATTLGILVPATLVSLIASRLHAEHADAPLALAIRRGLAPVALGFMLASGFLLLRSVEHGWQGYTIALVTLVVAIGTELNPLWLMAAGAAAGIFGWI
jgi:chromate transporter